MDLILWLPPGSAFSAVREAGGVNNRATQLFGWTADSEFRLGQLNLLQKISYILEQVNSKNNVTVPKPIPGPRSKPDPTTDANAIARKLMAAQGD